jgi:hypothetical protein
MKIISFLLVILSGITPAFSQAALDPGFKTLLELALDPKSHDGRIVTIRCAATHADLTSTLCPVYNDAGAGIGVISAMLNKLDVPTRRRLVQNCTGTSPTKQCVLDMTASVESQHGILLRPTTATWVDFQ